VTSLDDLLTVQALDTKVDQLRHRRATLPERAELVEARASLEFVSGEQSVCLARLRELRSSQKECEDHASLLDDKSAEVQASLYDGSVTSHKELEALQAEHRMLKQHQSEYEDQALDLMEQAEPVEAELADATHKVEDLQTRIADIEAAITVAEAEIDAEVDRVLADRTEAADGLPPDILSSYDTLRRQLGGVGAARLSGARCEGCHLEIPSAQLEGVRKAPPDALVTCPECLRILVR
jgi:uncharacterized protein